MSHNRIKKMLARGFRHHCIMPVGLAWQTASSSWQRRGLIWSGMTAEEDVSCSSRARPKAISRCFFIGSTRSTRIFHRPMLRVERRKTKPLGTHPRRCETYQARWIVAMVADQKEAISHKSNQPKQKTQSPKGKGQKSKRREKNQVISRIYEYVCWPL